jgi:RND family efflux transporter MFP subunit
MNDASGTRRRVNKLPFKITLVAVFAISLVIAGLVVTKPRKAADLRQPELLHVEITDVTVRDVRPTVVLSGELRPTRAANVRFEVAGQVAQRLVQPGQPVEEGDILAALDEADYRDAVIEAEADLKLEQQAVERDKRLLEIAKRNLALQEKEVRRQEQLGQNALASQSGLDAARQQLLQLENEQQHLAYSVDTAPQRLEKKRSALNQARRDLDRSRLRAPFVGVVNRILLDVGDYASVNEVAMELIEIEQMDIYLEVALNVVRGLTLGQQVDVSIDQQTMTGRIVALQADPDSLTHTYGLRIRLPGEGLVSGAIARVALPLPAVPGALTIPASAVLYEDGRQFVFRFVEGEGVVERLQVELGVRAGDSYVVKSGLSATDRVVARDVAILADRQAIKPQPLTNPS